MKDGPSPRQARPVRVRAVPGRGARCPPPTRALTWRPKLLLWSERRANWRERAAGGWAAPGALLGSAGDVETWLRRDTASRERETHGTVWSHSVLRLAVTRT